MVQKIDQIVSQFLSWFHRRPDVAVPISQNEVFEQVSPPPTGDELRALMGKALSTPTLDAILHFAGFASRMKAFAPFNVMLIYAQRPGAGLVLSARDWKDRGRRVRSGAIPIIILRPKGPISYVYEELDTDPPIERDPRTDVFAANGPFNPKRLKSLILKLGKADKRYLSIRVHQTMFGANLAGWIVGQPFSDAEERPSVHRAKSSKIQSTVWDISINDRLTEAEKFVTLLHELGHLFCGHVGAFTNNNRDEDEYGWPDRSVLPREVQEIEAELVAWWLAEREGIVTGSPLYLRPYLEKAGNKVSMVDLDRVTRAVARIRQYLGDAPMRAGSAG